MIYVKKLFQILLNSPPQFTVVFQQINNLSHDEVQPLEELWSISYRHVFQTILD